MRRLLGLAVALTCAVWTTTASAQPYPDDDPAPTPTDEPGPAADPEPAPPPDPARDPDPAREPEPDEPEPDDDDDEDDDFSVSDHDLFADENPLGADAPGSPEETFGRVSDDDLFAEGPIEGAGDDDDDDDFDVEAESWTDELNVQWNGFMRSDLRFRLHDVSVGQWYDRKKFTKGIDRNENLIGLRLTATYGDIVAKADIDFVLYGFSADVENLSDLSRRERINPYRFEAHRLYLQARDLFVDGLDLTVGQQLVYWGVGDQFNPTNNLNADDLEDILYFGRQQGNFMVKADYWFTSDWSMSGVVVPVFQPALLPRTGVLQVARVDRLPFDNAGVRHRIAAEQATTQIAAGYPTVVDQVNVVLPDKDFDNMAVAFRIGGTIEGQDVSLSYYRGRTDFPVPFRNDTRQVPGPRCNPDDRSQCINGVLATNVSLHYPRMYVYGFNMAGEIPWLEDIDDDLFNSIGYRLEAALIVPERSRLELYNGTLDLGVASLPAGEYDYDGDGNPGGGLAPVTIRDTPFAKWTLGLDYTFNKFTYLNVQWVHGLADEFGAGDWINRGYSVRTSRIDSDDQGTIICALTHDGTRCAGEVLRPRIGDYLVTGLDLTWLDQKLLTRLFTILDLSGVWITRYSTAAEEDNPDAPIVLNRRRKFYSPFTEEGFGMIIYPEIGYTITNGLELSTGLLLQIGKDWGKFGDPAAGGSLAWTRARWTF